MYLTIYTSAILLVAVLAANIPAEGVQLEARGGLFSCPKNPAGPFVCGGTEILRSDCQALCYCSNEANPYVKCYNKRGCSTGGMAQTCSMYFECHCS